MKKAIPAVTAQEKHLYLDYAATAPLSNSTIAFLTPLLSAYGNPSSPHSVGEAAKEIVSKARRNVARFLNAPYDCVFFTAGGAAGNALGILGYAKKHGGPILYSPTAHKSILACMEGRTDSKPLKVDRNGFLDLSYLRACLTGCASPPLVVTEYANSEIGSIQDVRQIIALTHRANGAVFLDCTGSISTIPLDVSELDVDMAAFSALLHAPRPRLPFGRELEKPPGPQSVPLLFGRRGRILDDGPGRKRHPGIHRVGLRLRGRRRPACAGRNRHGSGRYAQLHPHHVWGAGNNRRHRLPLRDSQAMRPNAPVNEQSNLKTRKEAQHGAHHF